MRAVPAGLSRLRSPPSRRALLERPTLPSAAPHDLQNRSFAPSGLQAEADADPAIARATVEHDF